MIVQFFTNLCRFLVSFQEIISISLYVALDIVKIFQKFLIYYDNDIYDNKYNIPSSCKETDLIEELGQVEINLCDKTGTLTQNEMVLRKCYVNGRVYENDSEVTFTEILTLKLKSNEEKDKIDKKKLENYFLLLTLCHSAFLGLTDNGEIMYQGSSPEELALLKGAAKMGLILTDKQKNELTIYNHSTQISTIFEVKYTIPFDFERKRMSVLIFNQSTSKYILLSKGSDDLMLNLMSLSVTEHATIEKVCKTLSKDGLIR